MTRHTLTITRESDRERVHKFVTAAPPGTRIEFKYSKRSVPQNSKFWAMLTDISVQKKHHGRKYTPEMWKLLFMSAWRKEMTFMPALDGDGFIPMGHHSSDLTKQEMSELMEFISAWSAQNGVTLHDAVAA